MKIRILLILSLTLPCTLTGQIMSPGLSGEVDKKAVFYNKGGMYVAPKTILSDAVVYVQGSVKVVEGSNIVQKGTTELIGDFIYGNDGINSTSPNRNVFSFSESNPALNSDGIVRFANKSNMAANALSVTYGSVLNGETQIGGTHEYSPGFIFKQKQELIFEGSVSKTTHFVHFPQIELADNTYFAIKSNTAATIEKLTTNLGSMFSVEGRPIITNIGGGSGIPDGIQYGHLILGQADRKATLTTQPNGQSDPSSLLDKYSYHVLDVQLYNPENFNTENKIHLSQANVQGVRFTGVTSPFQKLSNSYFMFHTIFNPTTIGNLFEPYVAPKGFVNPGEGYMVAMELSDFDHGVIEENWLVKRDQRAAAGFQFSSLFLSQKENFLVDERREIKETAINTGNWLTNKYYEDAYWTPESFLTRQTVIEVEIARNNKNKLYLANPFMAPFNLTGITVDGATTSESDYGVTVGSSDSYDINDGFWVVQQSGLLYNENSEKNYYELRGWKMSNVGATAYLGEPGDYCVAPQQVFALEVRNSAIGKKFKFDPTKFIGHNTSVAAKSQKPLVDELLIQVINEDDDRDDRTCIVFRNDATMADNDKLDDKKDDLKFTFDKETTNATTVVSRAAVYTVAAGDMERPMRTNAVPTGTKSLPLYISPTSEPRRLVLKPYRLETLQSVEGVWLEDKYTKTITQLYPETEYTFESTLISDPILNTDKVGYENRFVLHFAKVSEDERLIETDSQISCYYINSVLYIKGLNSGDINSKVEIFDLQGRLITQTKVDNAPKMQYDKRLDTGVYIVKITGKRNHTAKFMSTQN